ncbi:MAG: BON domain-containing protein [Gemmatimonadaceae bacterium]|nr:BON domain-containing protein [Gemmatimonadaceae bacterium]
MSEYLFEEEEEESGSGSAMFLALGALAGFAAGVYVAEQFGGFRGLTDKIREKLGRESDEDDLLVGLGDGDDRLDAAGYDDDDEELMSATDELEERVLEAFRNDPILSERAIDIGAIDDGIVELTGWVNAEDETHHALTVTRGVPGVETVVSRLSVRIDEDLYDDLAERYEAGDASLTEAHWEGQQVGTGRRRQGNSSEFDRHADPKLKLEDRSLSESEAYLAAADEVAGTAGRREKPVSTKKGGRTDGSPVAPNGVPKADHVKDPLHAND